ncbi:MAG: hypothetical protein DRN03_06190 [Thermoplasmata archaeon]|nr:MAG: hypothetical protein DRN03_06190 [Thermoplasmata archaeon]
MNKVTIYVMLTLTLFCITTTMLYYVGERRIDVYFSLYLLIYMITTEIVLPVKRKYRKYVNVIIGVLFAIFLVIVARRVMEILGWKI